MPEERWAQVNGWPEYEVSSRGRVKRILQRSGTQAGRILNPVASRRSRGGAYQIVSLWRGNAHKTAYIHRLVVMAFLGPCPPGCQVNHRDGVKANNHAENLEYCTDSANKRHAFENGLNPRGSKRSHAKLNEEQVAEICRSSETQDCLAKRYGVAQTTISKIRLGKRWGWLTGGAV